MQHIRLYVDDKHSHVDVKIKFYKPEKEFIDKLYIREHVTLRKRNIWLRFWNSFFCYKQASYKKLFSYIQTTF